MAAMLNMKVIESYISKLNFQYYKNDGVEEK